MSQLRHILSADSLEQLRDVKPLLEDPMQMHKTKFVKWLEKKADHLLCQYRDAGMSESDALVKVHADLQEITREWKATAKAKAQARAKGQG